MSQKMFTVKGLVESGSLTSIPSNYHYSPSTPIDNGDFILSESETVPIIDFSMLTSGNPDQRSETVQDIAHACSEWGFFTVINHGVPENLWDEMLRLSRGFFDLTEEEKQEYAGKKFWDPIRSGTSFNLTVDDTLFWRDYLKVHVHPQFNAPDKPAGLWDVTQEYCKYSREIANELLKAISESLGLEENYIHEKMDLEMGSQLLVINCYPPCPQPESAMGMPPHSDHGLLTLLIQNELGGLQIQHKGKWVPINPLPNSFMVNTGDHMEILSNGKYKSVVHKAVLNNKGTRISVGTGHGPTLDTVVIPAPELVDGANNPPAYQGLKYKDYLDLQQSKQLDGKTCLDSVRL